MVKTLHADGVSGKVYVYNNGAAPSTYASPTGAQLGDLHFHSDLGYLGDARIITATVTHPERTRSVDKSKFFADRYKPQNGWQTFLLGANPFGAIRPFVAFYNNVQLPSGLIVHQSGASVRAVSIYVTASEIRLFERWATFDNTLAQVNRTYRVIIMQTLFSPSGNVSIQAEPGLFKAGFNKLNTDYRYLRKDNATPSFYVGPGKTADVNNGGLRVVLADGSMPVSTSSYAGAFSGTGGTGVRI